MSLRKSDKIIAVLGVLILIFAGLGVFLYQSTEDDGEPLSTESEKMYTVTWTKMTSFTTVEGTAGKSNYLESIVIPPSVSEGCVLTAVRVNMTWSDDYTAGLLINKGEDTLTANVCLQGGEPLTLSSKGSSKGEKTIEFTINEAPMDKEIPDVEDQVDAEMKVLGECSGKNTATFDIDVAWEKGEKILALRPIKLLNFLRDKGNSFKLTISYDYYEPVVNEVDMNGEPPEEQPEDNEETTAHLGMMVNAGMTRW